MIGSGTRTAGVFRSVSIPESVDARMRQYAHMHGGSIEMLIRDAVRFYLDSGEFMHAHYQRAASAHGLSLHFFEESGQHYARVGGRDLNQPIPEDQRDIATLFVVRIFPEALYVREDEMGITFEIEALHQKWVGVA